MKKPGYNTCNECKFFVKISNTYCYHPALYGTKIENLSTIPDWCPLLNEY